MNKNLARWRIVASMAIFGTLAPFVRAIALSSGALALYRAVLATLVVGGFLLLRGRKLSLSGGGKEKLLLMLSGMAMGVNWILLFEAYKYTTVAAATLSYYFAPVIVTILCPILFREKLGVRQILCFVFSTLGLALVIGVTDLQKGGSDLIGILFGLGAAALYASVVILNKFIHHVEGLERTFWQFAAAVVILLPYVLFTGGASPALLDGMGWVCVLIVGLIHTGLSYCLYFPALRDLSGQEASILSYIDPLVAVVISVLVLREPLTLMQGIGGVLILGFTLLNELTPAKQKK